MQGGWLKNIGRVFNSISGQRNESPRAQQNKTCPIQWGPGTETSPTFELQPLWVLGKVTESHSTSLFGTSCPEGCFVFIYFLWDNKSALASKETRIVCTLDFLCVTNKTSKLNAFCFVYNKIGGSCCECIISHNILTNMRIL